TLGNGWYRGALTWDLRRDLYGEHLALLAQLELTYADGRTVVHGTDETWRAHTGPVRSDDLYGGQHTDLRRPQREGDPRPVRTLAVDLTRLVAPEGPPPRITERIPARSLTQREPGRYIADFGQNLVGWVHLADVTGPEGPSSPDRGEEPAEGSSAVVQVRHAEVLTDGELCTRPLRRAAATDTYDLPPGGSDLAPELTFHGFRYAEVSGAGDLRPEQVTAEVGGSDLRRTGWVG